MKPAKKAFLLSVLTAALLSIPCIINAESAKPGHKIVFPPVGQTEPTDQGTISGDIFGREGGFYHPFISIGEAYNDNIFNANTVEKDDFITLITPGIWLALPGSKEKLIDVASNDTSPGGLYLSRYRTDIGRRYQSYLHYNAEFELFADNSEQNTTNHKADAFFQYNFRGGLSVDLFNRFLDSHAKRTTYFSATGQEIFADELDTYTSNLFNPIVSYDITEKVTVEAGYSNYTLNYDTRRNDAKDRTDDSFSGYVFFHFLPKTSMFIDYELTNIDYDETILNGSKENRLLVGIDWDITEKSTGRIKTGYASKDFDDPSIDDANLFHLEAELGHNFTTKSSISLSAVNRAVESGIATSRYNLSSGIAANYIQRITEKIEANLNLSFARDTYKGELSLGGQIDEREDNLFLFFTFGSLPDDTMAHGYPCL